VVDREEWMISGMNPSMMVMKTETLSNMVTVMDMVRVHLRALHHQHDHPSPRLENHGG
jgi:hypothetical protein